MYACCSSTPPGQEEAELIGSTQAHLIGLVQVLQVQVVNEVVHNVQVVVLSCQVERVHSFLKRVGGVKEYLPQKARTSLPVIGEVSAQAQRTHIPTWLLALWSAPALTSMSMISKLPDQAAR